MCINFRIGGKEGKIYDAKELYLTKEASLKNKPKELETKDIIKEVYQAFAEIAEQRDDE